MHKTPIFLLVLFSMTHLGLAQEKPIPTIRISPEDVVQDGIQQSQMTTNKFVVRLTYTEAGARKMLAFREAHEGKKVRTVVGSFESAPSEIIFRTKPPVFTNYTCAGAGTGSTPGAGSQ
jgi:hypothetical protein